MDHGKVISMSSFFSCLRFYGDPSVKTFLQALRCRGILHQKMTSPVALQSIFSDRPISQYPPSSCLLEGNLPQVKLFKFLWTDLSRFRMNIELVVHCIRVQPFR